jgi:hypothetical protein
MLRVLCLVSAFTLKYFPANNCTPIIANISQNIKQTKSTLKMDGIACTNALTTTWKGRILINSLHRQIMVPCVKKIKFSHDKVLCTKIALQNQKTQKYENYSQRFRKHVEVCGKRLTVSLAGRSMQKAKQLIT